MMLKTAILSLQLLLSVLWFVLLVTFIGIGFGLVRLPKINPTVRRKLSGTEIGLDDAVSGRWTSERFLYLVNIMMGNDDSEGVLHALIEDLAAGKLVETSQFQLTEDQKNVKIPNFLIYLAGLIVKPSSLANILSAGSAPSLTTQDNDQFESLQKIFADCNKTEMPLFRLSPRLCPTEDQLSAIRRDFERKQKELEKKAHQAAEDLLSAEIQSDRENGSTRITRKMNNKKKKTIIKSKSTKIPVKHDPQGVITPSNSRTENFPPPTSTLDKSTSASTLEQVISQIQTESSTTEDDSDVSPWIPVSRSKDSMKSIQHNLPIKNQNTSSTNDDKDLLEPPHRVADVSINHSESTDTPRGGTKITADSGRSDVTSPTHQSLSIDNHTFAAITAAKTGETPKLEYKTSELYTAGKNTNPSSVEALKDGIHQLEETVKAKDQELQQEKQSNVKILSQKQQEFDDQIQALQLRLYISETRLKTFENALEQHVQAVASNLATSMECTNDTIGSSILHQYSSRNQGRISHNNQAKEEEPPSPLISRLLNLQKGLSVNVPSSGS